MCVLSVAQLLAAPHSLARLAFRLEQDAPRLLLLGRENLISLAEVGGWTTHIRELNEVCPPGEAALRLAMLISLK